MESSISTFPIVIQQQPGRGRRYGPSTFIRAHVMERYHRQRRARKVTSLVGQNHSGSDDNRPLGAPLREHPGVEGEATFTGYALPLAPSYVGRKYSKVEKDALNAIAPRKRSLEMERTTTELGLSFTTPGIRNFQLRDPRAEQSLMFMEISRAYFQILDKRQAPLDPLSKSWLPTAFADLALFHAILFNFSQHLYALCSIDHEKPALLTHKVGAIRQISARMESRVQGCSDAVIASILCLVSHELLSGDSEALQVHVRGLRQIINIRGGVYMLGLDGTLKTVYLNYELLLATVFKSWATNLPLLPSIVRHNGCDTIYPIPWNVFTLGQMPVDSTTHGFSNATIQKLRTLERMFSYPNIATPLDMYSNPAEPLISLEDSGDEAPKDANDTKTDHVLISLCLAISLRFPVLSPSPAPKLMERLKYHLNKTPIQSFWRPFPGALLFCLIVGVAASRNTPYRPWFVANLIRLTTGLAFESWEGLQECLCRFSEVGITD